MSIRLDIGVLNDMIKTCENVSESIADDASQAQACVSGLGDTWKGKSYKTLETTANKTLATCASIVAGAAKTLALSFEEVRKVASRLICRAKGFQGIFDGQGLPNCHEGLEAGELYYDDAYDGLISAGLINSRNGVDNVRRKIDDVADELSHLVTIGNPCDLGGLYSELEVISKKIDQVEQSMNDFHRDIEELNTKATACQTNLDGVFNVTDTKDVYEIGKVKNPVSLAWLLALPDGLKTAEQRSVTSDLKNAGLTSPDINSEGLRAFGFEGALTYVDNDTLVGVVSAGGYWVTGHKLAFNMAKGAGFLAGGLKTAAEVSSGLSRLTKGCFIVSVAFSGLSASIETDEYVKPNESMYKGNMRAKTRFQSNSSAKFLTNWAVDIVGAVPYLGDSFKNWLYSIDPETNLSNEDHFANWHYDNFGKNCGKRF